MENTPQEHHAPNDGQPLSHIRWQEVALRPNDQRARTALIVFAVYAGLLALAILSDYLEILMLEKSLNGETISDDQLNFNELRQGAIGILSLGLQIFTIVAFLNWFRRGYANLITIDETRMNYTDTWTILGFVIPIVNLVRPFQVAKEMVNETVYFLGHLRPHYTPTGSTGVVGGWWAMFLISNIVGRFALQSFLDDAETARGLIDTDYAYMVSNGVDVIAALVTMLMISKVAGDQKELYQAVEDIHTTA